MSGTSPQATLFARYVLAYLRLWPAVRLALSNPEIQVSSSTIPLFASELVELFVGSKNASGPVVEDVEDLLLQIMEDEFETVVDDDSQRQVSEKIVQAWRGLEDPSAEVAVVALESEAEKASRTRVTAERRDDIEEASEEEEDEEEEEEDTGMEVDEVPTLIERTLRPPPEVDEDGFTLVTKKGRR